MYCTNKYIKNILAGDKTTHKSLIWTNVFRNIYWGKKAQRICQIYCLNNKVKEITFKILHGIYPAKSDIDYSCDFCSMEKESIVHLFCKCVHKDFLGGYGKFH